MTAERTPILYTKAMLLAVPAYLLIAIALIILILVVVVLMVFFGAGAARGLGGNARVSDKASRAKDDKNHDQSTKKDDN